MNEQIRATRSVCPICLKTVTARLNQRENGVYMEKSCPEHGNFSVPVWRDYVNLAQWRGKLPEADEGENLNCPRGCDGCNDHLQGTCCVLLEVTRACNLQCRFCFANGGEGDAFGGVGNAVNGTQDFGNTAFSGDTEVSGGIAVSGGADMPDTAGLKRAIEKILRAGDKPLIQFSGGEPTLREDLPELIAYARALGCPYTQLNSNGLRLAEDEAYVKALAEAGLSFVFLQFDGVDDSVYTALRGKALYEKKLQAIRMCDKYRIGVTLVPTVVRGVNEGHIGAIIRLGASLSPAVRGVHFQPVSYFGRYPALPGEEERITLDELLLCIHQQAGVALSSVIPSRCDHPMCGFHGSYIVEDGSLVPLSAFTDTESEGNAADGNGAGGSGTTSAKQNREFIGRRWTRETSEEPDEDCCCDDAQDEACDCDGEEEQVADCCCEDEIATFDAFLSKVKKNGFTISAMAFQDAMNLDVERLRRCSLHVYQEGVLMPFCARYLTKIE